jgi:hypothetical protein
MDDLLSELTFDHSSLTFVALQRMSIETCKGTGTNTVSRQEEPVKEDSIEAQLAALQDEVSKLDEKYDKKYAKKKGADFVEMDDNNFVKTEQLTNYSNVADVEILSMRIDKIEKFRSTPMNLCEFNQYFHCFESP